MIEAPLRRITRGTVAPAGRRPFESPAGVRLLVPGWPQIAWGQSARGLVLLGSFLVAIATSLLAWGTWLAWVLLAFAFLTHVGSASDAIQQSSFPFYKRSAAPIIAGVLGAAVYLPILLTLLEIAWPGLSPDRSGRAYLVNCWAYRGAGPHRGDWVWLRLVPMGQARAARVVAVSGQELEWDGHDWRVDGRRPRRIVPRRETSWPRGCRFHVPSGQILVEPEEEGGVPPTTGSLVLVPKDRVIGRAWVRYYPVWDRRLL